MSVPSLHHSSSCIIYLWDSRLYTPCRLLRFPLHSQSLHFYLQKVSLFQQVLLMVIAASTSFSPLHICVSHTDSFAPYGAFLYIYSQVCTFLVVNLPVRRSLRHISQASAELQNTYWPLGSWGWTRQGQRR